MKTYPILDTEAKIWSERVKHSNPAKRRFTAKKTVDRLRLIQLIRTSLPGVGRILCVGSRDDSEVLSFISEGFYAEGIDIICSTEFIKQRDAHNIEKDFQRDQFDLVFSSHSLEHMWDAVAVMRGFRYVAKYGALIILPTCGKVKYDHPTIFDVMENPPESFSDLTGESIEIMSDFRPLTPYKLLHYSVDKIKKLELELLFSWAK
jgi:SAM-dependent methyltransferase